MSATKVISSATSDLISDQRVDRVCRTLSRMGFELCLVGRRKKSSPAMTKRLYETRRLNTFFEKGPFFYLEYNVRLFWFLLKEDADVLLANDLDTLPANVMASILKRIPLVYDSHEYFTEVPELVHRPLVRSVWKIIERLCIPFVDKAITVSDSIAQVYNDMYKVNFVTVRNFPEFVEYENLKANSQNDFHGTKGKKILLYQGSVNVGRGLEEMIEAMQFLTEFVFIIIGDGDILNELKIQHEKLEWKERIQFLGRIPFENLQSLTIHADLGISAEKNIGLSYSYCLPNKVFDYVQAGVPVLLSNLAEMKKLNDKFGFGVVLENHDAKNIARQIKDLFEDNALYSELIENVLKAKTELNWDKESDKIKKIFGEYLSPS